MFGGLVNIESVSSLVVVRNCFFEQNTGFNELAGVGGGSVIMVKGDTTTMTEMSNNTFFNSLPFVTYHVDSKGAMIQYSGKMNDFNSTFIGNRNAIGAAAYYMLSFAVATFNMTKFIWNFANNLGGAIGLTQYCAVILENILFLACSAVTGGVMSIIERSNMTMINCNFTNNYAISSGVIHIIESYDSLIRIINSTITNSSTNDNLFNLIYSNIKIISTVFMDNFNTLFSLMTSNVSLDNVNISRQTCNNQIIGCFINSIQLSNVFINSVILQQIHHFKEEGNIYLDFSSGVVENLHMENMQNIKGKGSCFDMMNSDLQVNNGNFTNFDYNCFYGENSKILLNNTYINNINAINDENILILAKYGALSCQSCLEISFFNVFFLNNKISDNGGAISLISYNDDYNLTIFLNNCSFIGNEVKFSGGSIYFNNVNAIITNCIFQANIAMIGGGIYYSSLCMIKFINILNISIINI